MVLKDFTDSLRFSVTRHIHFTKSQMKIVKKTLKTSAFERTSDRSSVMGIPHAMYVSP